jgi:hypothetical protein
MTIDIIEEPTSALAGYAQVPIAFAVSRVVDVVGAADERGRFTLSERVIDTPYVKDYDAPDGESPSRWATLFDVSHWGLFAAKQGGQRVGGAAVAFRTRWARRAGWAVGVSGEDAKQAFRQPGTLLIVPIVRGGQADASRNARSTTLMRVW